MHIERGPNHGKNSLVHSNVAQDTRLSSSRARERRAFARSHSPPPHFYYISFRMTHSNAQSIALTVSLVAWEHERKRLENQSSRLERKKHQDLHQRKRVHAHFDETIEEAFRERRRRKRQMSLVTLDVSRENDEEIRSIARIVEEDKRRKNVEEKRKKEKEKEKDAPAKRKRVSVLCCCFGPDSSSSDRNVVSSFSSSSRVLACEEEQFDCCAENRPL